MERLNPIFFINIIIMFFVLIAFGIGTFIIKNSLGNYYALAIFMIALFLLFIFYSINKGIPTSNKINIDKYKEKLSYNSEYFTISTYSYDSVIKWNNVEAIFLIDSPPLDGEYHNKEYRIFLNENPVIIRKKQQKWYNRILSSPKKQKCPMIKIDDYYNIDFNTFYPSIEKFLIKEKKALDFLGKNLVMILNLFKKMKM